ncbi:MAG: hypothetical protein O2992_13615 [Gemmatimonadetes bacterium]|nr:hypothetical protein [Gemmatimonadota bacterium]
MTKPRSVIGAKLVELGLEAVMVVFAVLIALAVQEWSDDRQMSEFADRARAAVLAEARANLEELQTTSAGLLQRQESLRVALRDGDLAALGGNVGFTLPEISASAWRAAQVSQAAPYVDYDWMIQVARRYEVYDLYRTVQDQILETMSVALWGRLTLEVVAELFGRMALLTDVHAQLIERLVAIDSAPSTEK